MSSLSTVAPFECGIWAVLHHTRQWLVGMVVPLQARSDSQDFDGGADDGG